MSRRPSCSTLAIVAATFTAAVFSARALPSRSDTSFEAERGDEVWYELTHATIEARHPQNKINGAPLVPQHVPFFVLCLDHRMIVPVHVFFSHSQEI